MKLYALTALLGISLFLQIDRSMVSQSRVEYVDVYILAGQSNMDGLGLIKDLPEDLNKVQQEVYIYNPNRRNDQEEIEEIGYWEALRPGHGSGFSIVGGQSRYSDKFGVELSFALKMRELNPSQRIALFKYAKGGASIHPDAAGNWGSWSPSFTKGNGINQFDHFSFHLKRALGWSDIDQDGKKELLRPAGILWLQGESDASYSNEIADHYKDNLRLLMSEIRALTGVFDLPIVIARISESHMDEDSLLLTYGDIVRKGQKEFTTEDKNAAYIDAPEGHGWLDPWHYDSATYIELGNRFAEKMHALKHKP